MKKFISGILLLLIITAIPAFRFTDDDKKTTIDGYWIRDKDDLQINITQGNEEGSTALSHILQEGNEEFPCDINNQPIYKNIVQRTDSLWTCAFLVVTINDCSSEYYYDGKILLTEKGKLEVICPGFKTMHYRKKSPRLAG